MKTQKTILVVDDDNNLRDAIVDVFQRNSFLTLEAKNGKEGVESALSNHPDLILLDLVMPVLGGVAALKEIRQDVWGAHVPIIILTNVSAANEVLVDDIITHKPLNYLIKSDWKLYDVMAKVEEILGV